MSGYLEFVQRTVMRMLISWKIGSFFYSSAGIVTLILRLAGVAPS